MQDDEQLQPAADTSPEKVVIERPNHSLFLPRPSLSKTAKESSLRGVLSVVPPVAQENVGAAQMPIESRSQKRTMTKS